MNSNTTDSHSIKEYMTCKIEIIVSVFVFIMIFFQLFPFYHEIWQLTYYLPAVFLVCYIVFQALGIEKFNGDKTLILIYVFFCAWLFYGTISIYWSMNPTMWTQSVMRRFLHFATFYIISQYLSSEKRFTLYTYMVLVSIIWNIGVCLWEMTTFQHLPTSRKYEDLSYIPTGATYNENDLAALFLVCCPLLLFQKDFWKKNFSSILLISIVGIMFFQGARLSLIVLLPFFIYHFFLKTSKIYKLFILIVFITSFYYAFSRFPVIKEFLKYQLNYQILSFGKESESQRISSTQERLELYKMSFEQFINTYGRGVGMGHLEESISPQRLVDTRQLANAHSLFFETLASDGIIGFLLMLGIVFIPLVVLISNKPTKSIVQVCHLRNYTDTDRFILTFYLMFFVAVSIPSNGGNMLFFWNMLAFNHARYFQSV